MKEKIASKIADMMSEEQKKKLLEAFKEKYKDNPRYPDMEKEMRARLYGS